MIYYKIEKKQDNIWLAEPRYDPRYNKKTESAFAQCNGYLGVRACTELRQLEEKRGTFISGFYHKAGRYEITELVNCPDSTMFDVSVNGEKILPDTARIVTYEKKFNIRNGEMHFRLVCDTKKAGRIELQTRRFVSKSNPKLLCNYVSIQCEKGGTAEIVTGLNGQIGNSGVSHFERIECRVFDDRYMYLEGECDDGQNLRIMSCVTEQAKHIKSSFFLDRRSIYGTYKKVLDAGECLTLNKYTLFDLEQTDAAFMQEQLKKISEKEYDVNRTMHECAFKEFWDMAGIQIEGASLEEEASIAFAQYHLAGMVPWTNCQCSAGAKGLTGEGYKGHVFWDTELFVMPMFNIMFPEASKNMLLYRYERLPGARKKAVENGYEGAMYPWQSARLGIEETPLYAAINIHTGKAEKVWSGIKEHHVTADIVHGLLEYWKMSGDDEFMALYGNEMILETAKFWYSRAVWIKEKQRYEIHDVIGPDEYTEHVDNNAYTNYLAFENVKAALQLLTKGDTSLTETYKMEGWKEKWSHFMEYIYLPKENEEGIIPQDNTFLEKAELPDIEKYRSAKKKQTILTDYSRDEVVNMKVLKQADVVMLLNLFPDLFTRQTVRKNVEFYEKRTIHDSSLSYCAHAEIMAAIGADEPAMAFFRKAMEIDLCDSWEDSTDGIHAASLGGIFNCVLRGFAGLRIRDGEVTFCPHLPKHWKKMKFFMKNKGQTMQVEICGKDVSIKKL